MSYRPGINSANPALQGRNAAFQSSAWMPGVGGQAGGLGGQQPAALGAQQGSVASGGPPATLQANSTANPMMQQILQPIMQQNQQLGGGQLGAPVGAFASGMSQLPGARGMVGLGGQGGGRTSAFGGRG